MRAWLTRQNAGERSSRKFHKHATFKNSRTFLAASLLPFKRLFRVLEPLETEPDVDELAVFAASCSAAAAAFKDEEVPHDAAAGGAGA